jgi:hypothetical protein
MKHMKRNKVLYNTLSLVIILVSLVILGKANTRILSNPSYIPVDDFGHYWAAGKLTVEGSNPYSADNVQRLRDHAVGFRTEYTVIPIAWTPPWSLILLVPFGLFGYPIGRLLWLITCITIILVCSDILWQIYSSGRKNLVLIWIVALTFGPSISVLHKGQITPWVLIGITGFLYYLYIHPNDWIAGAFTLFISLKPQLFYLFWPILLLWGIRNHRWRVLISSLLVLLVATFIAMSFNVNVVKQYIEALLYNTPKDWATPTIGGYLRLIFGIEYYWLQFIPPVGGLIWVLFYWRHNIETWSWKTNTPPLIFASILTVAYAWTYDQVIILVAIIYVLSGVISKAGQKQILLLLGFLMFINLLDILLHRNLHEFWFGWLAPLYLVWYFIGSRIISTLIAKPLLGET